MICDRSLTHSFVDRMNAENLTDITMEEAVDYLYSTDENYQLFGAAHIQHSTFTDDKARQEVWTINYLGFTMFLDKYYRYDHGIDMLFL